ncbi:unnamed protein product [Lota lota]
MERKVRQLRLNVVLVLVGSESARSCGGTLEMVATDLNPGVARCNVDIQEVSTSRPAGRDGLQNLSTDYSLRQRCSVNNMACRRKDSFLWGRGSKSESQVKLRNREREREIERTRQIEKRGERARDETEDSSPETETETETGQRNKHSRRQKSKARCHQSSGICYLVENRFLEWKAESVAEFLYKEEGLNKTAIGNFLGEREEMHIEVLKAFVNLHQFSNLNLVQALRQFLWSFRLPGEAQKIDRMMEAFAARYCDCNAGVFQSTDTCYILSFSTIMLNTSLHNPSVKEKPNLQRFFIMNRGINSGDDLSADLLTKLYESIYNEPFKIPEDDGNDLTLTFFNPDREGWLLKRGQWISLLRESVPLSALACFSSESCSPLFTGGRVKTWKRRWFILTDSCLYYFQYTTDKDPIGIIPLENLSVRAIHDPTKQYCLELSSCMGQKVKACKLEGRGLVEGKHQAYRLSAGSQQEQDGWIASIRSSISKDPFYDLVSSRRRRVIGSNNNNNNSNNSNRIVTRELSTVTKS